MAMALFRLWPLKDAREEPLLSTLRPGLPCGPPGSASEGERWGGGAAAPTWEAGRTRPGVLPSYLSC